MYQFKLNLLEQNAHVHFVGIGGISMSGLAEILVKNNFLVSGSDVNESPLTQKLRALGVKITIGHKKENIQNPDLVVFTAAVNDSNPEIQRAKELGIPIIDRATLLGELMKKYQNAIGIAGTHGKTTTTSMISLILLQAHLDPTILVGGELDIIDGNVHVGTHKYFITEACEYVESFLKFFPSIGLVLNIEADHLDYFRDINHIIQSFNKYIKLIPKSGYVIACGDDKNVLKALEGASCSVITYGIESKLNQWKSANISYSSNGFPCFDLVHDNHVLANIQLSVPGKHNIYNALAAAVCAYTLGIDMQYIVQGLKSFKGTHRRFEVKGNINGFTVIDDYAHHPTEIKATLSAASQLTHNKLWCVFQPHTYTRTFSLLDEFAKSFHNADYVIIADIYAARELDNGKIHSKDLVEQINQRKEHAIYMSSFEEIAAYILQHAHPGDMVITMGAGDIYKVGEIVLEANKMINKQIS